MYLFYHFNFPILSRYWLFSYLIVFTVAVCFFILDKQRINDLGLRRTKAWKRYIIIGFILAAFYNIYWIVVGLPIFSIGPMWHAQYGFFTVPYNFSLALIIGFVEETSFRGYILRNFSKIYSSRRAIIYSSILFGLYHLSLVYIFISPTSMLETIGYWSLFVLAAIFNRIFSRSFLHIYRENDYWSPNVSYSLYLYREPSAFRPRNFGIYRTSFKYIYLYYIYSSAYFS